ncbi:type I-F CRISPR-associated endoribonuclease Cas6/Csy4 [Photobacterium proteolyticum]|uniref:Type I-F CRISPR-associated endoribonuclease Cas6/Csy4 n=1 Tax=Photobacterium proteolyticum TaxID=1903952 RepID=A0A1Q9H1N2_9GAMM|nr:type I-F CRISPR-associated endoribonuclease Cas6/Csy4 [Photobacterium proteolyticum]OLQ81488.1 type I-F CRISPR-associated endoribonuclease Cas6/Csy4 [Photobacterium proteolyticum]
MSNRFYFLIRYVPDDVDDGLLAGRCISILHGVLSSEQNDIDGGIGVAFPQWCKESLGRSVAFVSENKQHLEQLKQQQYFKVMKADNLFDISMVKAVPTDVPEIRFKRNQGVAKCFAGEKRRRLARAKRRVEARGEAFKPQLCELEREVDHFHRAFMTSKSKGTKFLLHIQKDINIAQRSSQYSQYGLATNDELEGTVPELKIVIPLF